MSLSEELFEELKGMGDQVMLRQELSYYIELAYEDTYYFDTLLALATRFGKSGYLDVKVDLLQELWSICPSSEIAYLLALQFYELGAYHQSMQWLSALEEAPIQAHSLLLEGQVARQMGNLAHAKKVWEECVQVFPETIQAYYELGQLMRTLKEYKKAKNYWMVILEYFPTSDWASQARLALLEVLATSEVIQLHELDNLVMHSQLPALQSAEEFFYAAKAYQVAHQDEKALDYAKIAWELDHDLMDSAILQLELAHHLQRRELVIEWVDWLSHNLPEYHEAIEDIALMAWHYHYVSARLSQRVEQALLVNEAIDNPLPLLLVVTHYYLEQQQPETLLNMLNELAEEMENPEYLSYSYAKAYEALGDLDEAEPYYLDALDLALNVETLVEELVQFYVMQGKVVQAQHIMAQYGKNEDTSVE